MKKIESILVPELGKTVRLSDYLVGKFMAITTKKGIKKAISQRLVKVNGRIGFSGDHITGGEIIELYKKKRLKSIKLDVPVPILFEDDHLAIIVKPAGLIVSGNMKRTLVNALPRLLKPSAEKDRIEEPQPIHRLDKATSGLLVIGKTRQSVVQLNQLFAERKVKKTYHAVAIGEIKDSGVVTSPIKDKISETQYDVLASLDSQKYGGLHLLKVKPVTGRKHQIRIHLSELGNPILGDRIYGIEGKISTGKGLYLHATSLEFVHPVSSKKLSFSNDLPDKFIDLFQNSKRTIKS